MKVRITCEINEIWADPEDLRNMSDADVIELVNEDISLLLENAEWAVIREEK